MRTLTQQGLPLKGAWSRNVSRDRRLHDQVPKDVHTEGEAMSAAERSHFKKVMSVTLFHCDNKSVVRPTLRPSFIRRGCKSFMKHAKKPIHNFCIAPTFTPTLT